MKQYGFTREFIQSGDFRVYMAMAGQGTDRREQFDELMKMDGLITVNETGRPTLQYNAAAIEAYNTFIETVRTCRPIDIPPIHTRGICVLAGSGPSLDVQMLQDFANKGIPIISLGNASSIIPFAKYWIGHGDVLGYHPAPIERHDTIAFLRKKFMQDKIWDPSISRQVGITPSESPATIGFPCNAAPPRAFFENPAKLSNFGLPSSLTVGLSLAAALGFNNILMAGVDLGGTVDSYFAFGETPHKQTIDRKTSLYRAVKQVFPSIYKQFWSHGIRISAVNESPLEVPAYALAHLGDILDNVMTMSRRIKPRHNITTPAELNRKYVTMQASHRAAIANPINVFNVLPQLMADHPQEFDVPSSHTALAAVKHAEDTGGCSNCTKNKHALEPYKIFEKIVVRNKAAIEASWLKHLPDLFILQGRYEGIGETIFRSDKVKEETEYKEMMS